MFTGGKVLGLETGVQQVKGSSRTTQLEQFYCFRDTTGKMVNAVQCLSSMGEKAQL